MVDSIQGCVEKQPGSRRAGWEQRKERHACRYLSRKPDEMKRQGGAWCESQGQEKLYKRWAVSELEM